MSTRRAIMSFLADAEAPGMSVRSLKNTAPFLQEARATPHKRQG